jgi:hypothetical protein
MADEKLVAALEEAQFSLDLGDHAGGERGVRGEVLGRTTSARPEGRAATPGLEGSIITVRREVGLRRRRREGDDDVDVRQTHDGEDFRHGVEVEI